MKTCIFLLVISCFSASAYASVNCSGTIDLVYVHKNAGLFIRGMWRNDVTQLCNLDNTWKGITPGTCKAWMSMMETAKATSAQVKIQYSDNDVSSCGSIATYSNSPAPNYVMLTE